MNNVREVNPFWAEWLQRMIVPLISVGVLAIVIFSAASALDETDTNFWTGLFRNIGVGLVIGGGTFFTFGFAGFLFGIPRSISHPESVSVESGGSPYINNTNLEQVSDWLTKILIGVGLTQLLRVPAKALELATFLAEGFADATGSKPFIVGLLLYFGVLGFLACYLCTTWYLKQSLDQIRASASDFSLVANSESASPARTGTIASGRSLSFSGDAYPLTHRHHPAIAMRR